MDPEDQKNRQPSSESNDDIRARSHEIRSLIQGLLGYLAIFGDEVKPHLSVEESQVFDRIEFFAQRLSDHITELLDQM